MLTYLGYSEYILKSSHDSISIFEQNKIGLFSLGGKIIQNLLINNLQKGIAACS